MAYVFNTFTPATVMRLIDGSIARLKAGGACERKSEQRIRAARINELVQLRAVFENCVIERQEKATTQKPRGVSGAEPLRERVPTC